MPNERVLRSILIVDDDEDVCRFLASVFVGDGKVAFTATSASAARELARRERPDFVLVDLRLPDGDGLELIADLVEALPSIQIALFSADVPELVAAAAIKLGAIAVFTKPLGTRAVLDAVRAGASSPLNLARRDYPTLAVTEWDHVMRTLGLVGGNRARAAKLLGIARSALQRRINAAPPPERAGWPIPRARAKRARGTP